MWLIFLCDQRSLLLRQTEMISNCNHCFLLDVITHSCPIFNGIYIPPFYVDALMCPCTLRPGQNGRHFPDNILVFVNENVWISIKISITKLVWLAHWGRDKMDAIFQITFLNAFSWMKMYEFRLKFHWSLFRGGHINNSPVLLQIMARW